MKDVNNKQGQCKICGIEGELTFEHLPPKTAFNDQNAIFWTGNEMIKRSLGDKARYTIQQKGFGGYYLCQKCNNSTGSWYVPEYDKIIKYFAYAILNTPELKEGMGLDIEIKECNPLAFLKQIVSMICCYLPLKKTKEFGFDAFLKDPNAHLSKMSNIEISLYLISKDAKGGSINTIVGKTLDDGTNVMENYIEIAFFPMGIIMNLNPDVAITYGNSVMDLFESTADMKEVPLIFHLPYHEKPYNPLSYMCNIE